MSARVRITAILVGVLLVALAAVAWFLVLSPRLAEAGRLQEQAVQVETANLSLRNQYNQVLEQVDNAPAAAAQAQALFETMPQEAELAVVFDQIMAAADEAGIPATAVQTINATVPEPVTAAGSTEASGVRLAELILSVTATGKRDEALDFIERLQGLDRALLVTSTTMSADAQAEGKPGGNQVVQVEGTMFVLQSELPDLVATVEELIQQAQASSG